MERTQRGGPRKVGDYVEVGFDRYTITIRSVSERRRTGGMGGWVMGQPVD